MAKKKSAPVENGDSGGLSIGGDATIEAGRDANLAAGDIRTGQSLEFEADWRDSAMSALGDANLGPSPARRVEERIDVIEGELESSEPDMSLIQRAVGEIERIVPIVASVIRFALPFVK